jgi:hypothetical protein
MALESGLQPWPASVQMVHLSLHLSSFSQMLEL